MPVLSRRTILGCLPLVLVPRAALALSPAATVLAVTGPATVDLPEGGVLPLAPGMDLPAGARIITAVGGRAGLALADGTRLNAGEATRITLATAPGTAGSLNISGALVVDRRDLAAAPALTISSDGFDVIVNDAQVYLASLRGGAVFVKAGGAQVNLPGDQIILAAGEGVELAPPPPAPAPPPAPGAQELPDAAGAPAFPMPPPPPVATGPEVYRWSDDQIDDAFASVGLTA